MSIAVRAAEFVPAAVPRPATASFATIQAGRGLAALLVVLYHADKLVAGYWHGRALGGLFACGHAGVEFFFVLSGFIIAHVHGGDLGRPERLRRYLGKRFDRIYPLYWLVLGPVALLAVAGPAVASLDHVDGTSLVASLLLAGPDAHGGVLTVSWTLFHEVLFYAAVAVAVVDRRAGALVAAAWLALIAIAAAEGGLPGVPAYVVSPLNLLFAVGALTRIAVDRLPRKHPLAWAAAGLSAFVALGVEEAFAPAVPDMVRNLLYGLASAVALFGLVAGERRRRVAVPDAMLTLGAASYSIYLVHYPLLSVAAKLLRGTGLLVVLPPAAGLAVLAASVIAGGIAFHLTVERPLLAWLARRRRAAALAFAVPLPA